MANHRAHLIDAKTCPACNHKVDAVTGEEGNTRGPEKGDFSVCFYCGTVLRFIDNEANLAVATPEDIVEAGKETAMGLLLLQLKVKDKIGRSKAHES